MIEKISFLIDTKFSKDNIHLNNVDFSFGRHFLSFMVPKTYDSSQCHTPIRWNMNPQVLMILAQKHWSGNKNVPDCSYLEFEIFLTYLVPVNQVLTALTVSTLKVPWGEVQLMMSFLQCLFISEVDISIYFLEEKRGNM